jgi:hypothetical protein
MLQCLTTIMHKHGWYWTEEGALNANKEKWEWGMSSDYRRETTWFEVNQKNLVRITQLEKRNAELGRVLEAAQTLVEFLDASRALAEFPRGRVLLATLRGWIEQCDEVATTTEPPNKKDEIWALS